MWSTSTSAICGTRSTARLGARISRRCVGWDTGSWRGALRLTGRWVRDDDPDVGSPRRAVCRIGVAAVRLRDRAHDRQAQACSASAACWIGAGEALERLVDETGWKAWTEVLDVELHASMVGRGPHLHATSAVAQGVVDQIAKRLLEPLGISQQATVLRDGDVDSCVFGIEAVAHPAQEIGDVDIRAADGQRSFIRAREHEQIVGERREAIDLLIG